MFEKSEIEKDLLDLPEVQFFAKYLLRPANWYFYNKSKNEEDMTQKIGILSHTIAESLAISHTSSLIVGSARIGFSMSPNKLLAPFRETGNISDIDIAVISSRFFDHFWFRLREIQNEIHISQHTYGAIANGLFNGYINGNAVKRIRRVRSEWDETFAEATKRLQARLGIEHPITYRVYRSWEDLEQYHVRGIKRLRQNLEEKYAEVHT